MVASRITIGQLLSDGSRVLRVKGVETPWLDTCLILASVLNVKKEYLAVHDDKYIDAGTQPRFWESIGKRGEGTPVQYITGVQEFMSLSFHVSPSVLIPRSDTETLVEEVLRYCNSAGESRVKTILDLGTGSGCVAVSLARNLPDVRVWASDIDGDVLKTAKLNAQANEVSGKITFVCGDLFAPFKQEYASLKFDVIVSNPPYVSAAEMDRLQLEVRAEPRTALYGGTDGLDFYPRIASEAPAYMTPGALLALEIGWSQAKQVTELLKDSGWYGDIKVVKDMGGRDRVVVCKLQNKSAR